MTNQLAVQQQTEFTVKDLEMVLVQGDLSKLAPEMRLNYYKSVCESVGLNPLTKPFAYITLNGKLTLYALKDCTDQLREIHGVSITFPSREAIEGVFVVTAHASKKNGRHDESIGAVPIEGLKGEAKANAMMKAETKAKRRVTLSICGLGMLDETEIESIPDAKPFAETPRSHAADSTPAAPSESPVLTELYKRAAQKGGTPEVFAEMHSDLVDLLGFDAGDAAFQKILGHYGKTDIRQFKSMTEVRKCMKEMYEAIRSVHKAPPEDAIDVEAEVAA